jgi:hypothetical protein
MHLKMVHIADGIQSRWQDFGLPYMPYTKQQKSLL